MPMPDLLNDLSRLSLAEIEALVSGQSAPPIDSWNPPHTGDSRVRIAADGRWFHDGTLITRENLIRLFATILRHEPDGSYVLVTPIEKQTVTVEDAPLMAVEVKSEGAGQARTLAFRLNVDGLVVAGPDHRLRFDGSAEAPAPYLMVRNGIEARIARAPFYEIVEWALEEGGEPLGIWSSGQFFSMAAIT